MIIVIILAVSLIVRIVVQKMIHGLGLAHIPIRSVIIRHIRPEHVVMDAKSVKTFWLNVVAQVKLLIEKNVKCERGGVV